MAPKRRDGARAGPADRRRAEARRRPEDQDHHGERSLPGSLPRPPLDVRRRPSRRAATEAAMPPEQLRHPPPKRAGRGPVECLAKRPATGPCSADESVASCRRCQQRDARSFHGLCFPSKILRAPLRSSRTWLASAYRAEARRRRARRPSRQAAAGWRTTGIPLPIPAPLEPKPGERDADGGPKPSHVRRLFSVAPWPPRRDPAPGPRPKPRLKGRASPGESVRGAKFRGDLVRDAARRPGRRRSDDPFCWQPREVSARPSWGS